MVRFVLLACRFCQNSTKQTLKYLDKTFRIVYTTEKGSTTFIEVTALNKASCELWIATIRGAIQKNDGIPESPMTMLRKVMRLRESHPTSSPEAGALFKSESWTSSTSTIAVKTDSGSESGKPQKPSLPFDPTSLRSRSVRSHSNATDSFTSDSSGTMVNWKGSTATSSSKNRSSSLMSPPLSPESSPSQIKTQLYRGKTDDTAETAVNEPMAQSAKNLLDDFKMTPGMKITKAEYDELQAAYASKVAECRDMYQCLSVFSTRPASALTRDAEAQTSEELVDSSWDETLSIIEGYF